MRRRPDYEGLQLNRNGGLRVRLISLLGSGGIGGTVAARGSAAVGIVLR